MAIKITTADHCFGTVQFWKSAAPHYGVRTWKSAMDRFAVQHGKAVAMLADESARIVERGPMTASGKFKLFRQEMPREAVVWSRN